MKKGVAYSQLVGGHFLILFLKLQLIIRTLLPLAQAAKHDYKDNASVHHVREVSFLDTLRGSVFKQKSYEMNNATVPSPRLHFFLSLLLL